jgi:hypothetical protein
MRINRNSEIWHLLENREGARTSYSIISSARSRRDSGTGELANDRCWHEAAVRRGQNHVRFLRYSGREMLAVRLRTCHGRPGMAESDPSCVKTH